ncbi:MAG: dicarboxylate/amino acid:cation symporter, partial [Deltaproteobacteria bacterium]|nr:dicarboxylate/amino acid:cation symporter [Deltaproteobacteria bacterium]
LSLTASGAAGMSPSVATGKKLDFVQAATGIIPSSVLSPFVDNSVLTIIFLAVLAGLALRKLKNENAGPLAVEELVATFLRVTEIILGWVIRFVPLAVFGVVAKTVGQYGLAPLKGLAAYLSVAILGLFIQISVVYQIWLMATLGVSRLAHFWRGSRDAVVYALGASSSLATLPVTLRCLDRMQVSKQSSRLAACVGSNFNHDGILLYEAMAVLFVAQVHGIHLSLSQQALAALSCLVAGIGIAGIPDAGLISLALVLSTVGLPLEVLPLLLTVDWVLSRGRAITNVLSDMVMAVLLDHFMNTSEEKLPAEQSV